jgi:hypothetical protein
MAIVVNIPSTPFIGGYGASHERQCGRRGKKRFSNSHVVFSLVLCDSLFDCKGTGTEF